MTKDGITLNIAAKYAGVKSEVSHLELVMDETNAWFAEQMLTNKNTLSRLVEKAPSLPRRILDFFTGAKDAYSGDAKLSKAAARYYKTYKKLFDEFAARNQGNNAFSIALEGAGAKKMPVTNTETDSMHVTGDNDEYAPGVTNTNARYALPEALKKLGEYDALRVRHIESSGKDRVVRNYDEIIEFIKRSKTNPPFERLHIGIISDKTAALVKASTGEDIKGYDFVLASNFVFHIYDSHGNEATEAPRGQKAVDDANIENIIEAVIDPDDVSLVSDSTGTALRFEKVLEGRNVAITITSTKKSTLTLKSAWIINEKSGGRTPSANANALAGTPEANSRSSTNDNITENAEKINPSDESFYKCIPKRLLEASKTEQHISQPTNAEALIRTPEARSSMDTVPTDSITENAEKSNSFSEKNEKNSSGRRYALSKVDAEGKAASYTEEDLRYEKALQSGNMRLARQMVEEAARAAGYRSQMLYHGTKKFGFTEVDFSKSDDKRSFFLTDSIDVASSYTTKNTARSIHDPEADAKAKEGLQGIREAAGNLYQQVAEIGTPDAVSRGEIEKMLLQYAERVQSGKMMMYDASDAIRERAEKLLRTAYKAGKKTHPQYAGMKLSDFSSSKRANAFYEAVSGAIDRVISYNEQVGTDGIYAMYANTTGMLRVDGGGKNWNRIGYQYNGKVYNTTREISAMAKKRGFTGVHFKNLVDMGGSSDGAARIASDVYITFADTAVKSADIATYDDNGYLIPLSKRFDRVQKDFRYALPEGAEYNKPITADMSDQDRYELLKDRSISLSAHADQKKLAAVQQKFDIADENIEFSEYGDRKRLLRKIADEFGVFRKYKNADVLLDFGFSRGNFKHSISSQRRNYTKFVKMLSCLDEVINNAVGIEVHKYDNYKPDPTLDNVYVLASAFVDGNTIVPVKLEIKQFSDKENTLYVAVALESIKIDEVDTQGNTEIGVTKQYARSSTISIAELFEKINPSDESFVKYIPDGFLNEAQMEAKSKAWEADERKGKTSKNPSGDSRYALDIDSEGNTLTETQQEFFKDSKVRDAKGRLLVMYHGTKSEFTVFEREKLSDKLGFFFTSEIAEAKDYGTPVKCYLDIKNPIDRYSADLDQYLGDNPKYVDGWYNSEAVVEGLKKAGYDGIYAYERGANWYIPFDSEQIKRTDNKKPTTHKDTRYALPEGEYRKPITAADVDTLRSIGQKSINAFSTEDIEKAQKWAYKFYQELGVKSPFFRAWFGDWRAMDKRNLKIVSVPTIDISQAYLEKGNYLIDDTGWEVYAGKVLNDDTRHHSGGNRINVKSLNAIDAILKNSVLLDTVVSERDTNKKSENTAFLHKLYTMISYDGKPYIAKTTIEEYYNATTSSVARRAYNLKAIKIEPAGGQLGINSSSSVPDASSIHGIADLFAFVKQYDKEFSPKEVNPAFLNADGTPKVFYHGTNASFTAFDKRKARSSGLYGRGFYFTTSASHSAAYGNPMAVYLNIRNPLSPGAEAITKGQIRKFLAAVAENEDYSIENYGTYDIERVLSGISARDAFSVIQDINATAIGDFVEAIELFN